MKYIPIYKILLVRDGIQKAETKIVTSPVDAYQVFKDFIGTPDREHFVVMLLDTRNQIVGLNAVSVGSINATVVHPRETFKSAILIGAAAIIIAHNHPSGDPAPSSEDLSLSTRLIKCGELVGIPILDHLIIGDDRYISLKEKGLI